MDFLKKHYEKILLGIVLVGLAGAFVYLPVKIGAEKQQLVDMEQSLTHPKVRPLTNLGGAHEFNEVSSITCASRRTT